MERRQENQPRLSPRPRRAYSLRQRLLALLGGAFLAVLLVNGVTLFYLISQGEQLLWQDRQVEAARLAANTVADFVRQMHNSLVLAGLPDQDTIEATPQLVDDLLGQNPALLELVRLNSKGQVFAGAYQDAPLLANLFTIPQSVWFAEAAAGQFHLGNVQVSSGGEPYLIMAIPAPDGGVVAARLRMNVLWDVVAGLRSGETGQAYVVDQKGRVVAHSDPEVALVKTSLQDRPELEALLAAPSNEWSGSYVNFENEQVVGNTLPVSGSEWVVITEVSQAEVSAISRTALLFLGGGTVLIGTLAMIVMAWSLKGLIFRPVGQLQQGAERIGHGDLDYRLEIIRQDEFGQVAGAFNQMAGRLQALYDSQAQYTRRLGTVATLGERLSAILDFDQLLAEMVNQVKESFDYYHAHVYITDNNHQNLVMTAGAGEAGAAMKTKGHQISLNAPTSLVARAARTGEIISIDNVREAEDWLPNPLLPDTYSEMAIPISLEGQVVGVLDVQQDKIAGLDEGDAGLLRSLANHVAVAIRNARLFEDVETSLAEAHAAQEQYAEQSWDRNKVIRQNKGQVRFSLGESTSLTDAAVAQARQQALAQKELALVTLSGGEVAGESAASPIQNSKSKIQNALVAPITLRNVPIGNLQLHGFEGDAGLSEGDRALVEAIIDQVAQAAENLRLINETQERAGRERLIGQISDKLRRAQDFESLMKIGVEEISRAVGPARTFVQMGAEDELRTTKEPDPSSEPGPANPENEESPDTQASALPSDQPVKSAPTNGRGDKQL